MCTLTTSKRFAGIAILVLAAAMTAASAQAQDRGQQAPVAFSPAAYSRAVTGICAHALLFEGTHAIGTRAGALEVADDIRASSRRRLSLVAALSTPPVEMSPVARWLAIEQRLADTYATTYVSIFDLIAAPWTPEQATVAPGLLATLIHAPDRLRQAAALLEQQLRVPDCIGG
jgi:hypothetical protein